MHNDQQKIQRNTASQLFKTIAHNQFTPKQLSTLYDSAKFAALPSEAFVRIRTVQALFACSRATVWRWVKTGKIPAPKKLSEGITAWNVGELKIALAQVH